MNLNNYLYLYKSIRNLQDIHKRLNILTRILSIYFLWVWGYISFYGFYKLYFFLYVSRVFSRRKCFVSFCIFQVIRFYFVLLGFLFFIGFMFFLLRRLGSGSNLSLDEVVLHESLEVEVSKGLVTRLDVEQA